MAETNFIHSIIEKDLENHKYGDRPIYTRFPPEPNGYLHIGHAKSICLNFSTAAKYGGKCNLRYDDTNPVKEDMEYINSIEEDVRWLGFAWTSACGLPTTSTKCMRQQSSSSKKARHMSAT